MNRPIPLIPKLVVGAALAAGLMVVVPAATGSSSGARLAVPGGLKSFLRTPNEPRSLSARGVPTFSRTPAFAWRPVRGADRYQFELSTSRQFTAENALIWKGTGKTPAAAVPVALPWISGEPASMYWRVRAIGPSGFSNWSSPRPFNMRWTEKPRQLPAGDGWMRWTQVPGATGYEVWLLEARKVISTITNVADEREYYLSDALPSNVVHWRVRAERRLYGEPLNGLPAVSYGPWSPTYSSQNGPNPLDDKTHRLGPQTAVSGVGDPQRNPHSLVPAITAGGNPSPANLWRTYFFTDSDCVNRVFVGYPVASPAYAPRSAGLASLKAGTHVMADREVVTPTELGGSTEPEAGIIDLAKRAKIDLWDSNWSSGRYYAVAVPVVVRSTADDKGKVTGITYEDVEYPQDACEQGRMVTFGKSSESASLLVRGVPSATGLSPGGRLFSAVHPAPKFYGSPLVTWEPATSAVSYEVQWSRNNARWHTRGTIKTASTSTMLPLTPGKWYYRVRGVNDSLPGNQLMSWSRPTLLVVTPPSFGIVGG